MALRGTLIWTCTLAVWFSSASKDDSETCSLDAANLTAVVEEALQCGEALPWSGQQTAALLLSLSSLTHRLQQHQLKECQGAEPQNCPEPEVPENGGLACVTADNQRLCKPMCNHGYDFAFLRISRLYDKCSEQTNYKWDTQYVGGNKLAVCNRQLVQISGAKSAYFPKDQDCRKTKSISQLQNNTLEIFISEVKNKGIPGAAQHACLVCG
ncbi:hypothetical protein D5F01_LYC21663 [Larimichthys crocea]|uniref:Uncharacterized protein n=1 Tax=Larimichthys crocea TaxID=215358 RepID=A0A6G0HPI2_LARCR|nr:hypothetical protein D5F01_LYC21663 [Larimichthys crocea]